MRGVATKEIPAEKFINLGNLCFTAMRGRMVGDVRLGLFLDQHASKPVRSAPFHKRSFLGIASEKNAKAMMKPGMKKQMTSSI